MPIVYDGYNECHKCGKRFNWMDFEWHRSKMNSGIFYVEQLPKKPRAEGAKKIDEQHVEYTVSCPHCGFINQFICNINSSDEEE